MSRPERTRRMQTLNIASLNRRARAVRRGEEIVPGCTGKARYLTAAAATEARDARRAEGVKRISYYKCQNGDHWHLTTHRQKGGAAARTGG